MVCSEIAYHVFGTFRVTHHPAPARRIACWKPTSEHCVRNPAKVLEDGFLHPPGLLSPTSLALLQQACLLQQDEPSQQVFAALEALVVKANIKATPTRAALSLFI
jgi:hypothetical protein